MQDLETAFRDNQLDDAFRVVEERLGADPQDQDALVGKARLLAYDGELEQAREILERIVRINPKHIAAKTYQAVVVDMQGRRKSADVLLAAAAKGEPSYGPAHYNQARQLLRSGKPDAALAELDRALKDDPKNSTYTLRRAEVLLSLGRDDDAATTLSALVTAHPDFAEAWLCAGRAAMKKKNVKAALGMFCEGLTHSPMHRGLALAAFQAAAVLGDTPFCARTSDVVGEQDPHARDVLKAVVLLLQAPHAAKAEQLAHDVDRGLAKEVADFLDSIASAVPSKRGAVLTKASQTLRTLEAR